MQYFYVSTSLSPQGDENYNLLGNLQLNVRCKASLKIPLPQFIAAIKPVPLSVEATVLPAKTAKIDLLRYRPAGDWIRARL